MIEPDDWGSIRMPSAVVYRGCLAAGYSVDWNAFERYDGLASETDLELLFKRIHPTNCIFRVMHEGGSLLVKKP